MDASFSWKQQTRRPTRWSGPGGWFGRSVGDGARQYLETPNQSQALFCGGPAWNQVREAVRGGCQARQGTISLVRCPSHLIHTDHGLTHGVGAPISEEFKALFSSLSSPSLGVGSRESTEHSFTYSSAPTQATHMLDGEGAPS